MGNILNLISAAIIVYVVVTLAFLLFFGIVLSLASFLVWDWLFTPVTSIFLLRCSMVFGLLIGTLAMVADWEGFKGIEVFEQDKDDEEIDDQD